MITRYWRQLLEARAEEAVLALLALDCVDDLVVGGSLGRGEPWPLSDIDIIAVVDGEVREAVAAIVPVRDELVGWWASSGRAQSLDIGWICFNRIEAEALVEAGVDGVVEALAEPRWLHGTDKIAGGRGAVAGGIGSDLAALATETRFLPQVRQIRQRFWLDRAAAAFAEAEAALGSGDGERAARRAGGIGALAVALLESWGEREGGMARFATRFERIAHARSHNDLARDLSIVTGSSAEEVRGRATNLPAWLQLRVELAFEARTAIDEDVTWDQNVRDQVLAFETLGPRRKSIQVGPWAHRQIPFDASDMVARARDVHDRVLRVIGTGT